MLAAIKNNRTKKTDPSALAPNAGGTGFAPEATLILANCFVPGYTTSNYLIV